MTKKPKAAKKAKAKTKAFDAQDYLKKFKAMDGVDASDFAFATDPFAWVSQVDETIPTGSIAIDRLTGGGWPVGRIVEVAAWEGVGKSTLMDQSLAECQRLGGIGCLIDTEQSRDNRHMKALGVDLDSLLVVKAETVEDGFARIDQLLNYQEKIASDLAKKGEKPPMMLIVWDSIGATPSNSESEGDSDEKHVSAAARTIKMNLRRITQRVAKLRVCLVLTNHFYKNFMAAMGKMIPLETYGGSGIKYHTSLRLFLTRKRPIMLGGVPVGHEIEAKIKKTRINKPHPPALAGLVYGCGVHNAWTLFEWGKVNGTADGKTWIVQRGAWSTLNLSDGSEVRFQHGFVGLGEVLTDKPEVYREMIAHYFAEETADVESSEGLSTSRDPEEEGEAAEESTTGSNTIAALADALRGSGPRASGEADEADERTDFAGASA